MRLNLCFAFDGETCPILGVKTYAINDQFIFKVNIIKIDLQSKTDKSTVKGNTFQNISKYIVFLNMYLAIAFLIPFQSSKKKCNSISTSDDMDSTNHAKLIKAIIFFFLFHLKLVLIMY